MSNYHYGTGDCIQDLSTKLAESDIDSAVFDEAWRALGVVVAVLYRKRRPVTAVPPPLDPPEQLTAGKPTQFAEPSPSAARPPAPIPTANDTHLCPDCGFESVTAKATKLHFRRMHGDLMHPLRVATERKPSAKELWERSHAPSIPYPGDAA